MTFHDLIAKVFGLFRSRPRGASDPESPAAAPLPVQYQVVRFQALVFQLGSPVMPSDGRGILHLSDDAGRPMKLAFGADDLAELQAAIGPAFVGCNCAECAERDRRAAFFQILRVIRRGAAS